MIRKTIFREYCCRKSLSIQRNSTSSVARRFSLPALALTLLAGILMAGAAPLEAQTTATVTPINYAQQSNGMLQAGDGNFYAPSLPILVTCINDSAHLCSYIFQMTKAGATSIFFPFDQISTSDALKNTYGIEPSALIVGMDGNLYGTCLAGGPGTLGTIFKIDIKTKQPTVLKSFGSTGSVIDLGYQPSSLIQAPDGSFYFTNGLGIYQLTVDPTTGTGTVSMLHTFAFTNQLATEGTNSTSLIQGSDGDLYLTMRTAPQTVMGGGAAGAIARFDPRTGVFTPIFSFAADGSQGDQPMGPLTEGPDGGFYGVTLFSANAATSPGVGFEVTGGGFSLLHPFTERVGNYDGVLTLGSDGNFYGATLLGGDNSGTNCMTAPNVTGCGTIYQMTPAGAFTTLHQFEGGVPDLTNLPLPPPVDGASPTSPLVQSDDGSFYGTQAGNPTSIPIVYQFSLTPAVQPPIQLTFNPAKVIPGNPTTLTWQVLNAYSLTAQQCGASIVGSPAGAAGAGEWTGKQTGTMVNSVYTGTATITPTANGLFKFALTCGGNESGFATLSAKDDSLMQIVVPAPDQLTGTVKNPFNLTMSAIGGKSQYFWNVPEPLPEGITFDQNTGTFGGTPLQHGSFPLTVEVKDSSPNPLEQSLSITLSISSGLVLHQNLLNPTKGVAYLQSLAPDTQGGITPYTWQVTAGSLPTGLQLDSTTGMIKGTPTAVGPFSFTITVTDFETNPDTFQAVFNLVVAGPLQVITPFPLPEASVGVPYKFSLEAGGGTQPYTFSLGANSAGSVPPGMILLPDGTFTGTPIQFSTAANGFNSFNVTVSDSSNPVQTAPATVSIAVKKTLQLLTGSLPDGTVGVVTDVPLEATGGVPPYIWTATATPNPNIGIRIVNGNVLEYDPTVAMVNVITLTVTDSETTPDSKSTNLDLTTLPAPLATTTTLAASNTAAGTGESVTLTATVTPLSGATPTGQVIFTNGTTNFGTVPLDATGKAVLQTSFASTGVYSITAAYSGNGVDAASVSTPLTETVVTPGITAAVNPVSLTIKPGSSGQLVITITPTGGYTGSITFSCGTLPKHVSCTFAPPSLTIDGTGSFTDTLTVSTAAPLTATLIRPGVDQGSAGLFAATFLWLPGLLAALFGLLRRKGKCAPERASGFWIIALLFVVGAAALSSCGGSLGFAKPGTYTIPVTISAAGGTSQSINATVIVQ
ncbi:MAG TPA: choice-of-anchor tandem repeat GloVer-containing protein [Terracidiphilus sp.]|jgi:uncharacterized repeat protein (TIGR03803 family)